MNRGGTRIQTSDHHPLLPGIMNISVGIDAGLALKTRKGTGLYKVSALKGVWYRDVYGRNGVVADDEFGLNFRPTIKTATIKTR